MMRNIQSLPQALGLLNKVSQQLAESQTAIVQILEELDYQDFEARRQRAIVLRMAIDARGGSQPVTVSPEKYTEAMLEYETRLRAEYDAMFWIVRLLDWYKNLLGKES